MSVRKTRLSWYVKPALLLAAILAVFLIASAAPSYADSGWETVKGTSGVNGGGEDFQTVCIKKIGSYYIKCVDNPNKEFIAFYYSKNEKTGYKQFLRQTSDYERLSGYFDVAVKGDSYICYIKDKIMLGRIDAVDFTVKDETVSSRHAVIEYEGGKFFITDNNSANGTRLNGTALEPNARTELPSGSTVEVGRTILVLSYDQK